jgi:hypothetical protein
LVRTDAGQDGDGTHPTSLRVVRLLHQASSAGSGPLPATAGGQVQRMTPPESVIPRVTPTATDRGPDHHRTVGSLTAIPGVADRAAATGGHFFGWSSRRRRARPLRYTELEPIDERLSSACDERNCGRRMTVPEKLSLTNAKGVRHNKERAVRPSHCANWCAIRLSTGPVGLRRREGLTAVGREGSNANCADLHRWHLSGHSGH